MCSLYLIFLLLLVDDDVLARGVIATELSFDQNYKVIWGDDHVVSLNHGKEIQLTMDNSSGYIILPLSPMQLLLFCFHN